MYDRNKQGGHRFFLSDITCLSRLYQVACMQVSVASQITAGSRRPFALSPKGQISGLCTLSIE